MHALSYGNDCMKCNHHPHTLNLKPVIVFPLVMH